MTTERPKHLIKYATPEAGLNILKTQALCWQSPNALHSPFECNGEHGLPFTSNELLENTVKLATSLIFNPERPKGDTPLMSAILRWRDEQRFASVQEAQTVLRDLLSKMVAQKDEQLQQHMQKWRAYCESLRLCCFSSSVESLSAWEKFTANHEGFAIALKIDEDSNLNQAQPVTYSNDRPQLTTLKEQIGHLIYNTTININQRFAQTLLQKPQYLSSEQEWRVLMPVDESFKKHNATLEAKALNAGSIKAVYLGANCSKQTIAQVVTLSKTLSPAPRLFAMQLNKAVCKLEALPLNSTGPTQEVSTDN